MSNELKTYGKGARLFCDFHFGGKPKAICVAVEQSGNGKESSGRVRVRLLETVGAYRKGEEITISSFQAVPVKQEFRKPGSVFRYVNTCYQWQ
jgi:hypothetical protein